MSISSINYGTSVLGAQIRNINQQLTDLSTQLSTGKLSQNYSGMGTNEGFAIASRAQLSNIAAYTDTITNVNVNINLENTALQSLTTIRNTVQTGSATSSQDLNVNGQTVAQNTAAAQIAGASGSISGSSLEGSNTDIADEFTKLIVTQQAYSANTKVITTANSMVQDLLNVLR